MWFVRWLSGSYCPQTSGTLPPLVKMCFSRSTRRPFSSFLSFHSSYEMLVFPHSRGCSLLSLSLSSPEPGLAAAVFSLQSEVFMLTSIHKVALTIPSTSCPVCTKVGNRCLVPQCRWRNKIQLLFQMKKVCMFRVTSTLHFMGCKITQNRYRGTCNRAPPLVFRFLNIKIKTMWNTQFY